MAERDLQIILSLKDQASAQLKGFSGKLQKMKPTFTKLAIGGTAALTAIGLGINDTVQKAAVAEGAMAKFKTVFGESTDEMLNFVDEVRKEMPSAKTEIISMAAGLQDLLVPMGLSRDKAKDLSKETIVLANKIAAFNDEDPSRVLEAFRSGLVGSSEPLRAFGIDARITALEATALDAGLLEVGQSFKDLDPAIASAVQAEALLIQATKQSADAINGFEENNDSFIRRQQELNATIIEAKEAIGKAFLPIIDSLLKKLLPVINKIAAWAQENPELIKTIVAVASGLAILVTVVGALGLVLPAVITGFTLLLSPIGLIVIAIIAVIAAIVLLVAKWEFIKGKALEIWTFIADFLGGVWNSIKQTAITVFTAMSEFFKMIFDAILLVIKIWIALVLGAFVMLLDTLFPQWRETWQAVSDFFRIIWEELKVFIEETLNFILQIWTEIWQSIIDFFTPIWEKIGNAINTGVLFIKKIFKEVKDPVVAAWKALWEGVKNVAVGAAEVIKNTVRNIINFIIDKINKFINLINEIKNKAGKFGKALPNLPNIPRLAKGGIVTAPTIAEIGEAGPEAVIPLNKMGSLGTVVNITVNGDISGEDLIEKVQQGIMNALRPNQKLDFI